MSGKVSNAGRVMSYFVHWQNSIIFTWELISINNSQPKRKPANCLNFLIGEMIQFCISFFFQTCSKIHLSVCSVRLNLCRYIHCECIGTSKLWLDNFEQKASFTKNIQSLHFKYMHNICIHNICTAELVTCVQVNLQMTVLSDIKIAFWEKKNAEFNR